MPSTAELFDDPRPRPGRHFPDGPAGREPVPALPARPRARRPARAAGTAVVQRLGEVESKLRDFPIDVLIELRDRLEALLAGDRIDEAELALLLDPRPGRS